MGITGLLPFLSDAFVDTCLSDPAFRGKRVGIDTSIFIYRGVYKLELEDAGESISYCCNLIKLLRENGMIPLFVFDGRRVPAKAVTHAKRDELKKTMNAAMSKQEKDLRNNGKLKEADRVKRIMESNIKAPLAISSNTRTFLNYLKRERVDFVIAPYEADAQLASLCDEKIIDVVLTEDSDLMVYNCPYIIFKLDSRGFCTFYNRDHLPAALGEDKDNFDFSQFVDMCILSGCDYLPSFPGIGIKTAQKLMDIAHQKKITLAQVLKRYSSGLLSLPRVQCKGLTTKQINEYLIKFQSSRLTFNHQVVFSFINRKIQHLTPLPEDLQIDVSFLGDLMENIDPNHFTWGNDSQHRLYYNEDYYDPTLPGYAEDSIWNSEFKIATKLIHIDPKTVCRPQKESSVISKTVTCDCGRVLKRANLTVHIRFVHNNIRPFMCEICGYSFIYRSVLARHALVHGTDYRFFCEYDGCNGKFHTKTNLKVHVICNHLKQRPNLCVFKGCKKTFVRQCELTDHIYDHYGIKPYHCGYPRCPKKFDTSIKRNRHERSHYLLPKIFECTICSRRFAKMDGLKKHLNTHSEDKPFECVICHQHFKTKQTLTSHNRSIHLQNKSVSCPKCKKVFRSRKTLRQHTGCKLKQHNCYCGSSFQSEIELDNHGRTSHTIFKCNSCGSDNFWDPIRFHRHENKCKRRWVCTKCNKSFLLDYKPVINRHIKDCNGEDQYIKCEICIQTFPTVWFRDEHMKKNHKDEIKLKTFPCPHCQKKFMFKSVVQLHCRKNHPDKKTFIEVPQSKENKTIMEKTISSLHSNRNENTPATPASHPDRNQEKTPLLGLIPRADTPTLAVDQLSLRQVTPLLGLTWRAETSTSAADHPILQQDVHLFDKISCHSCGYQSRSMDDMEWHQKECRKVIPESTVTSIEREKTPLRDLTPRADPVAPAVNQPVPKQKNTPLLGFIPHAETLTPSVNQPVLKQDVAPLDDIKCPCGFRSKSLDVMAWHKNGCTEKKIPHQSNKSSRKKSNTSQKENRARVRSLAVKSMDVACPNCRRRFNSREEMKVHHNKMHSIDLRTPIDNKLTPEKKEIVLNVDKVDFWDVKY